MSPLLTVDLETAGSDVKSMLAPFQEMMGFIPQALQVHAISPDLLSLQTQKIGYFIQHPTLSNALTAMIRLFVSQKHPCQYCIDFNEAMLVNAGIDFDILRASYNNPSKAPLEPKDLALFLLVIKAVGDPVGISAEDLTEAQSHGWSEKEVFDAMSQASNQVALNMMLNIYNIKDEPGLAQ
ncbi:MAG: hypothetical protein HN790_09215 [Methylococcales bacterium]|nr:hypothetical protein [Methylococcales bacterium]